MDHGITASSFEDIRKFIGKLDIPEGTAKHLLIMVNYLESESVKQAMNMVLGCMPLFVEYKKGVG